MNRIFPLILLLFVLTSCKKSNNDKAHDLVEAYCNDNFYSPEDYKPVSFDTLKVYFKPYEQSHQYLALDSKRQELASTKDSLYKWMYKGKQDHYDQKLDSIDKAVMLINIDITNGKQTFQPVQEGWTIRHRYNKKDESGRIVEGKTFFILNKDFTKVLQSTDEG